MKTDTKLFSPRFSLLFITLPQTLLVVFLTYAYQSAGLIPILPLIIIFGVQTVFNIYIMADAVMTFQNPVYHKYAPMIRLIGFILIMSTAMPFLLKQFQFTSPLSPETIYAVLCLIPLLYITAAILYQNQVPLMPVGVRITICVCFPLLIAVIPHVFSSFWNDTGDLFNRTGDIILIFLFALFFAFICLVTSLIYHFRTKRSMPSPNGQNIIQENDLSDKAPKDPVTAEIPQRGIDCKKHSVVYSILTALIALFLPVICLYLNNEVFYQIIGDFSGVWFYILAIVNGIAMLIPAKNKWVTMVTLFFKSMGFLYVCYFTVVLLKYVPIGLAVFYVYLIPLLVLTPTVLFVVELFQIIDDFQFLKQHFTIHKITAIFACGMLSLCVGFTGNCYVQKVNFNNAMCYLNENEPEYPSVNIPMLKTTLSYADQSLQSDSFDIFSVSQGAPLLSEIYRSIVLGGKVLTADSYSNITRIFLPEEVSVRPQTLQSDSASAETERVKLYDVKSESNFDQSAGLYKTWIHLQMKNETDMANQEYSVKFTLPEGVYISDYYLDVNGERKYGIISEKRSAQMTYNSIVSRSRDPGIIYYEQGNSVELKVFPFNSHETRQTGFLVIYKQSETININGHMITLAGEESIDPIVTGDTCFMPASSKSKLAEMAERTPKYYFIADISWMNPYSGIFTRIREYAQNNHITNGDVYLTDYHVKKSDLTHPDLVYGEGGFNMALAMGMIYRDVIQYPDSYPVIIVASDNFYRAALSDNRKFIRDFPESEFYYLINEGGTLTPYRFTDNSESKETSFADHPVQTKVLTYQGFYFKDNGLSEISYKNKLGFSDISYGDDLYTNALRLNEKIEKAVTKAQLIETVKDGFDQRILTKNNSFIVLETKEQEDELHRRNKEFLEGKNISASSPASMSEPGIIITVLFTGFLLVSLYLKRRRIKKEVD